MENNNDFSIESAQAKLRNALGPFWTLSELISDSDTFEKMMSTESGIQLLIDCAKRCESNKDRIKELIRATEIDKLKLAAKCYELALEHDYCPMNEDTGEYGGSRPDEIASDIITLINNM